ncbi:serine hydrolase domain-containing protein [Sphingobacterium mizutaii]|uniref:serine hydrolase domain-containing protein n=1 Tax=Sphingobacterium mizutaii TaxID=1010 RepID=UPI0016289A20|nr:serine hydrolase domain-containing protein [Sphingobacterium mizutaii]
MKIKITVTLIILIYSISIIQAQNQKITRIDGSEISTNYIDSTVIDLMKRANIPGVALAILNDNKISYLKTYGYKNELTSKLLDTSSIVYAASFSKAVCAFMFMKLVEKGIMELDKPLYQYLKKPIPDYDNFSSLKGDERWKKITSRIVLNHTTGFPNVRWFDPTGKNPDYDSLGVVKIYFEPGLKYAYSGEGFKLLQLAMEERTGKSFDILASELIFKPIGMLKSGYVWHESFGEDLAIGHNEKKQQNIKRKRNIPVAGGSMVTTISDYAKFIQYLMQGKGLNSQSFAEMIKPQIKIYSKTQFPPISEETTDENSNIDLSYGLGWGVIKTEFGRAFFKEGGDDAWKNYNINFVDRGISIIIITNSVNGSRIFKELLEKLIADTYTPWRWEEYIPI